MSPLGSRCFVMSEAPEVPEATEVELPRVEARAASEIEGRAADGLPARELVTGVVLCGGESLRMGRDKALLEVDGQSLLARALAVLEPLAGESLLACGERPRYRELGRRLVLDSLPRVRGRGAGPLAGLAAGLAAAEGEWVLALACDLARVDSATLATLLRATAAADADVGLFEGERGVEPLCGVYRASCREPVRAALARGERKMTSFWEGDARLRVVRLPARDPGGGRDERRFVNLNTPRDLAILRQDEAGGERLVEDGTAPR